MADYISREAAEQVLRGIANGLSVGETEALKTKDLKALYKIQGAKEILNSVDNDLCFIPAADVQPVKRGEWKYYKNTGIFDIHKCSVCATPFELPMDIVPSSVFCFCPHCGARMIKDGDAE